MHRHTADIKMYQEPIAPLKRVASAKSSEWTDTRGNEDGTYKNSLPKCLVPGLEVGGRHSNDERVHECEHDSIEP